MPRIQIDDHVITADTNGWCLSEEVKRQSGAKAGEPYLTNHKYCPTLPSAINLMLELRLRKSDATTLKEIREEIRDFRAQLTERFTIRVE